MLRFTNKIDYAFSAMVHIAEAGKPVSARQVSEQMHFPLPLITNVLKELAGGNILKSFRGTTGGYWLARDPQEITVQNIIEVFDGPLALTRCISDPRSCSSYDFCRSRNSMQFLQQKISNLFDEISLSEYG